jgi:hypothetical protein
MMTKSQKLLILIVAIVVICAISFFSLVYLGIKRGYIAPKVIADCNADPANLLKAEQTVVGSHIALTFHAACWYREKVPNPSESYDPQITASDDLIVTVTVRNLSNKTLSFDCGLWDGSKGVLLAKSPPIHSKEQDELFIVSLAPKESLSGNMEFWYLINSGQALTLRCIAYESFDDFYKKNFVDDMYN